MDDFPPEMQLPKPRDRAGAEDSNFQPSKSQTTSGRALVWEAHDCVLLRGDAYTLLRDIPSNSFDAVITDPPYSSGGLTRGDRIRKTSDKYVITGTAMVRPDFSGDNRDQRGFLAWATLWLTECVRIVRPGGALMVFVDWRQLPIMTDAIQAGGWIWRGIHPWDKTAGSRPQRGWFRQQCEYVLLATNGSMGKEQARPVSVCAEGIWRGLRGADDKHHITGKPVELMKHLMQVLSPGSKILDPFAGSGSTLLAAIQCGLQCTGIELNEDIAAVARERLERSTRATNTAPSSQLPAPSSSTGGDS